MRQILILLLLNFLLVSCLDLDENKWETHLYKDCQCIEYIESIEDYKNEPVACSRMDNNTIKWGFVFGTTCEVIIPFKFDNVKFFGCGLAPVKKNGNWGAVNRSGNLIIQHKFKELETFHDSVAAYCDSNNNWGVVNTKGRVVINPKYHFVNFFHANVTLAQSHEGKWIVLNNKGKELPIKIDSLVNGYFGEYDEHTRINISWGYKDDNEIFDYPIFSNGKKVILYVYKNEYSLLNEKTDTRLISIGKNKIPKNQLKSIY